ncbi:MAG: response regulator [Proteobacteria bacterium]|nr:response regulator [Pseudomonadota bacterium]
MKNVLIIDDEKSLLFSMKAGFEPFKNELCIHTAENGREAISVLESIPIDLVVTDLKMPEMDGFEVLSHLSEHYPTIPAMVMTAFNTPEIESRLTEDRSLTIFEKPVNFDEFSRAIIETVNSEANDGSLGISLTSFMQLIHSEQKTCLLEVKFQDKTGHIYFAEGELINAVYSGIKGEEAVYKLLEFQDAHISFKRPPQKKVKRIIKTSLMHILMEGMRRIDELKEQPEEVPSQDSERENNSTNPTKTDHTVSEQASTQQPLTKGVNMASIKEVLEKFKAIDGFMAAGAFSPNGELASEINVAGVNIAELGALANDVLLKAQKATEIMGVGRGQLVHVEAPKAHIFARCLNESTDYAATASGRAHVHLVMVIEKEGNVAMAKMRLESIIMEIAEHFR